VDRLLDKISGFFNWIAVIALLLMFAVVSLDILSSKIFNRPITAAVDFMSLLATIVAAFSLSQTIQVGRHIEVEFIVTKLPGTLRKVFNVISSLFSMCFFILVVWKSFAYARNLQTLGEATLTQHIPVAPFVYGLGVACVPAIFIYALRAYRYTKEVR